MILKNRKGVALIVVLGVLLVVAILANVILAIILSHARFTQHGTGRIQAQYASLGAINYAFDYLARGHLDITTCGSANGCTIVPNPPLYNFTTNPATADFWPPSISSVTVVVKYDNTPGAGGAPAGGVPWTPACEYPSGTGACINVISVYTTPQ